MPDHSTHCEQSYRKYGKRFSKLHAWMDAPVKGLGGGHRIYRHDLKRTPHEARELFGEFADHACIDHILLDKEKGDLPPTSSGVLPSRKSVLVE
ncbi:hypothetical protein ES703_00845 [subsurface metagenome]